MYILYVYLYKPGYREKLINLYQYHCFNTDWNSLGVYDRKHILIYQSFNNYIYTYKHK